MRNYCVRQYQQKSHKLVISERVLRETVPPDNPLTSEAAQLCETVPREITLTSVKVLCETVPPEARIPAERLLGRDVPPDIVSLTSHARDVPDEKFRKLPRCEGEGDSTAKAVGPAKSRLEGPEIDPGSRLLFKNSTRGEVDENFFEKEKF